ncbi:cdc42 effector protein 3 [Aplochiton taeniatus]
MPAKAPIYLKPNNSKKGKKCRLRDILSPDMISPPLGDFRHTIHIGRGGERDTFGDMSFLQGKFELLPGKSEVVRPPHYGNHNEFLRANSASEAAYTETPSPVLKNAISLPTIGGGQALTLPLLCSTAFSLPPEALEDKGGPTPPGSPARAEEPDMLQVDALLRSLDAFARGPVPPPTAVQSRPDVLLDLIENREKAKQVNKVNRINTEKKEKQQPSPFFINGAGIYNGDGSLSGSRSYGSPRAPGSFNGKEQVKGTCSANGSLRGGSPGKSHGGFNGNGNCNGGGCFTGGVTLCPEKELSDCHGDWVDRDSGVEEGRVCDLDFDLSKERSGSHDSLSPIAGSLLSLELDMGPSILDDVLNIMDRPPVKSRP